MELQPRAKHSLPRGSIQKHLGNCLILFKDMNSAWTDLRIHPSQQLAMMHVMTDMIIVT